jgi:hypothetical protein
MHEAPVGCPLTGASSFCRPLMTFHKQDAESPLKGMNPLDISVALTHRSYDLTDTIVRARAVQTLSAMPARFPVYRRVRCAVRSKLEALFDDIALRTGLDAHRLEEGYVLLDGPGLFVSAWGASKSGYSSFIAHVWADSVARAESARETLFRAIGERRIDQQMFVINWQFTSGDGNLSSASFEEIPDERLLDEAYPALGEPLYSFIGRYLDARDTVLVLQGTPGTGKTRLVRAILAEMPRRKGESAEVMYTADRRTLEKDEVFVEFITGSHDAFVIEDADHMLMARSNGNVDLHRFLAVADGVVRAQGRKIIFTTNLPNLGDIDEALLRPGRCFASVRTRPLIREEAARLVARIRTGHASECPAVLERAFPEGKRSASLAEVFRACAM